MLKQWKSLLFKKIGYRRIESPYKELNSFQAKKKFLNNETQLTIFDIGASVGQTSAQYRSYFPKSQIYSFEPIENSFKQLQVRFANDPAVQCFQMALSDGEYLQEFYLNRNAETSSLLPSEIESTRWSPPQSMESVNCTKIKTNTLDNFCKTKKIDKIDILKIDAQGADLKILNGSQSLLKAQSIPLIYTEALFVPLYIGQASFFEIGQFLHHYGYQLFDLFQPRYDSLGKIKWADALFYHNSLKLK